MSIECALEILYAAAAVATIAGFVLAVWEYKRRDDVGRGGDPEHKEDRRELELVADLGKPAPPV